MFEFLSTELLTTDFGGWPYRQHIFLEFAIKLLSSSVAPAIAAFVLGVVIYLVVYPVLLILGAFFRLPFEV